MKVHAKIELIGDDGKVIEFVSEDVITGVKWPMVKEVFDILTGAIFTVKSQFSLFEERPAA